MVMQGLQVFDEAGNCTLDITDRLCKVLGVVETGFTAGSIYNPLLKEGELWVVDLEISYKGATNNQSVKGQEFPYFWKDKDTLYWSYGNDYTDVIRLSRKVLYGVY